LFDTPSHGRLAHVVDMDLRHVFHYGYNKLDIAYCVNLRRVSREP
jgi:hypothetical protein